MFIFNPIDFLFFSLFFFFFSLPLPPPLPTSFHKGTMPGVPDTILLLGVDKFDPGAKSRKVKAHVPFLSSGGSNHHGGAARARSTLPIRLLVPCGYSLLPPKMKNSPFSSCNALLMTRGSYPCPKTLYIKYLFIFIHH